MPDLGKLTARHGGVASLLAALVLVAGCRSESGYADCMPGALYLIGCSAMAGSVCSGDPNLRVCNDSVGPGECVDGSSAELAYDDDSGVDSCPETTFACPASGRVAVNVQSDDRDFCAFGLVFMEPLPATPCTAGAMYEVGCTSTLGTMCTGDPTIAVCMPGVVGCDRASSFAFDDDTEGRCPLATFTCPAGGVVIEAAAFGSNPATCEYALRELPAP